MKTSPDPCMNFDFEILLRAGRQIALSILPGRDTSARSEGRPRVAGASRLTKHDRNQSGPRGGLHRRLPGRAGRRLQPVHRPATATAASATARRKAGKLQADAAPQPERTPGDAAAAAAAAAALVKGGELHAGLGRQCRLPAGPSFCPGGLASPRMRMHACMRVGGSHTTSGCPRAGWMYWQHPQSKTNQDKYGTNT